MKVLEMLSGWVGEFLPRTSFGVQKSGRQVGLKFASSSQQTGAVTFRLRQTGVEFPYILHVFVGLMVSSNLDQFDITYY